MDEQPKSTWRFSKTFWFANSMELCERAAYYGFFILITMYLSTVVGFSDVQAGIISGIFSGALYLLPPFMGIIADRIGFRRAMILAFSQYLLFLSNVNIFSAFSFGAIITTVPSQARYIGSSPSILHTPFTEF